MRNLRWSPFIGLLAACAVNGGDGFEGVMSGSASATATATDGSSSDGSTASDSDTSGDTETTNDATGATDSTVGATESTSPTTTGTATDAPTTTMSSTGNTGTAGSSGGALCGGTPLDVQLDVPPGCATTCTSYGSSVGCGAGEICRLKDTTTGVCESCVACGNLNAPCAATADCDIVFTCFQGQCTAMCDFNTPQTCGNPKACTNVGHPTHGVCDPNL